MSTPASTPSTPMLPCTQDFQWCRTSTTELSSGDQEQSQKYSDIENEIIENGYNGKKTEVEIDGGYVIDLHRKLQYKKDDPSQQHRIERFQLSRDRRNVHLRTERFGSPVTLGAPTSSSQQSNNMKDIAYVMKHGSFPSVYFFQAVYHKDKKVADIVEEAAQGIVKEGKAQEKLHEAQWLSQQLLAVKHFGDNVPAKFTENPCKITETCIYLFTKNSFWYELFNRTLREATAITPERIETVGPFALLLHTHLFKDHPRDTETVYRGLGLNDEQRKEYMKTKIVFTAFTSTSRNRTAAEMFGNTLLIMNLKDDHMSKRDQCGANISHLSHFPDEEEFLIWPGRIFHFTGYEYDDRNSKHVIYLSWSNSDDLFNLQSDYV
ncbi:unnamed protein product [Didymodactylos carnosus]|uniref:NAD(P)(+)--arginine ADP-ribosyltransferase n=1 Tax=Didymodactylos carnosus TaxID=1234261 RepID=A0A815YTF6_9BILA|nr:unnamed protein product [Didymodactylos carnosus]CAF4440335.1 unnamed protein product [Didymodactylos carnosus]